MSYNVWLRFSSPYLNYLCRLSDITEGTSFNVFNYYVVIRFYHLPSDERMRFAFRSNRELQCAKRAKLGYIYPLKPLKSDIYPFKIKSLDIPGAKGYI